MDKFKIVTLILLMTVVVPLSAKEKAVAKGRPAAGAKQVLADFDEVLPKTLFGWDNQAFTVPNPVRNESNNSATVAVWTKNAAQWKGLGFLTKKKIDFERFPVFSFKILSPVTGKLVVKFFNEADGYVTKVELPTEPVTEVKKWQTVKVDLSRYRLRSDYYNKVEVMPLPESAEEAGPFYFDDFILNPKK